MQLIMQQRSAGVLPLLCSIPLCGALALSGCGSSSSSGSSASTVAASTSGSASSTTTASAAAGTSASRVASGTSAGSLRPPTLSALSPASGYNDRALTLDVSGTGFLRGAVVRLTGPAGVVVATAVTVANESSLTALFAPGAAPGTYALEIETSVGVVSGQSFELKNLLDVDQTGAFAVGYEDRQMPGASGDQVDTRIYYPALTRGLRVAADPGAAPYPVIVLSHGFKPFLLAAGVSYRSNTFLAEHLASLGYVVICPDLSSNNVYFGSNGSGQANSRRDGEDALAAIDFVTALGQDASHPLFALIDEDRAGLVGHSRGADGSLIAAADEVVARGAQARVRAVVAMAPPATDARNSNAPLQFGDFSSTPTLLIAATEDGIAPLADQQAILSFAGAPSWLFEIVGGNHSQYKDSASRILSDGVATLSLADQQAICRRYAGAWLHRHVKGLDLPWINARILQGAEVSADARLQNVTVR